MKFRYYITSNFDGTITGTDDEAIAKSSAESEDDFVVDTQEGKWLQPEGTSVDVEEVKS